MIVTLIHGQSHKGSSYHMGKNLVANLPYSKLYEFSLPKDMPNFCLGCYGCMNKGFEVCPHNKDMEPILTAILQSDVLVFTTPTYCMRTTGSMKAFLDHCFIWWMVHRPVKEHFNKSAIVISTGAGAGMKHSCNDIKTSLRNWGLSDIQTLCSRTMATNWEDVPENIKKSITKKSKRILHHIQTQNHKVKFRVKLKFYMMRFMQKKGWSASEQDYEYWKLQGWLNKNRPWK